MAEVASAFVSLVPSAKGWGSKVSSEVGGETDKAGNTIGKRFGSKIGTALKFGLAGGAVALVAFGKSTVSAASDAQQSLGATETVFGKFAKTVVDTSDEAAQKYGLSANVYRENANLIGSLFKNQGVATDELAGKTEEMIGIGADLAATFGGTTTDAVGALGAAFKGEYDQLERYGVSLKESTVSAELAARGQDKLTGAALASAKQQAVTDLIMRQSTDSVGAFGRESNTLAGQQQRLSAQFDNLKATIGMALIPVITQLASFVNATLLPALGSAWSFLQANVIPVFARVRDAIANVVSAIKGGGGGGGISAALASVTAAFQAVVSAVVPIVKSVVKTIRDNWGPISAFVQKHFGMVRTIIANVMKVVAQVITLTAKVVGALWNTFGADILRGTTATFKAVGAVISAAMKLIGNVVKLVLAVLKGDWSGAWSAMKAVVSSAWGLIKAVVSGALDVLKSLMRLAGTALTALMKAAWTGVKAAVSAGVAKVVSDLRAFPGEARAALGNVGTLLYSAGRDLIQGMINGVKAMAGSIAQAAGDVVGNAISAAKSKLGINSPSKVFLEIGHQTGEGLRIGLEDTHASVQKEMARLVLPDVATFRTSYDGLSRPPTGTVDTATAAEVRALRGDVQKLMRDYQRLTRQG